MNDSIKAIWTGVAVLAAVLAILAAAIVVVGHFGGSDILLGMLSFAGAIVVASMQYRSAKEKEIEARLFTEKQAAYTETISTVMDYFHEAAFSSADDKRAEELARKLQKIRAKLVIWGSSNTIVTLDELGHLGGGGSEVLVTGLRWFSRMFTAIRSDLGHNDPPGLGLEIALGMIKPNERATARAMVVGNLGVDPKPS